MLNLATVLPISVRLVLDAGPDSHAGLDFFFPVVLSKADLHQHFLCLLKLKPRQLNTGDLSFICCLIAGSQGLAWALILTFMSQVSLAQEL